MKEKDFYKHYIYSNVHTLKHKSEPSVYDKKNKKIYLQNEETDNLSTMAKLFLTGITPML